MCLYQETHCDLLPGRSGIVSKAEGDQGIHGKEWCLKRPKESKRPGRKSKTMPRTERGGEFLWKPYVPWRNDGLNHQQVAHCNGT